MPGVYKWRAMYSGDDNNLGVSITACLDPNEASTLTAAAVVTGTAFSAGPVEITLFSTPVLLSRLTVGAGGTFTVTVTIPADTAPGAHRLVVTGAAVGVLAVVFTRRPSSVEAPASGGYPRRRQPWD